MTYARSVFVVHNIAHQGRGPMAELAPLEVPSAYTHFFRLDDPIGGVHMNVMKAGLMAAHRVVAVSHGCLNAFAAYNTPLETRLYAAPAEACWRSLCVSVRLAPTHPPCLDPFACQ